MGIESDYTIMSAIGDEDEYVAAVGPSIIECKNSGIYTQEAALDFLSSKVQNARARPQLVGIFGREQLQVKVRIMGQAQRPGAPRERMQAGMEFLRTSLLCHVPVTTAKMKTKAAYLGLMIRK